MEQIGQWAIGVCTAAAVCTAVLMLVPKGSQEKVLKITISCFFLICAVVPIVNSATDINMLQIDLPEYEYSERSQMGTDEAIISQITARLNRSGGELLTQNGCNDYDISFKIENNGGEISVASIEIVLAQKDIEKAQSLSALFYQTYGAVPQFFQKE